MHRKRQEIYRWLWEDVKLRQKEPQAAPPAAEPKSSSVTQRVSEIKRLLIGVYSNPLSPTTILYERAGLSRNAGNKIKRESVRLELVTEEKFQMQRGKGRGITCLSLTDKGYHFLGVQKKMAGKGGNVHCTIQDAILKRLEEIGLDPSAEYFQNGKAADVGFLLKGQLWAAEVVVTSARNEHDNLMKDLDAGFAKVVFIAKDTKTLKVVSETLKVNCNSEDWQKAHICLIEEFFEIVRSELGRE